MVTNEIQLADEIQDLNSKDKEVTILCHRTETCNLRYGGKMCRIIRKRPKNKSELEPEQELNAGAKARNACLTLNWLI